MQSYAPISLKWHAAGDLIALMFLLVSPWLFGFSQHSTATQYTVALVAVGMGLNFMTDYPLGLFKKVPFNMPWVAKAVGVGAVLNSLLTRPVES